MDYFIVVHSALNVAFATALAVMAYRRFSVSSGRWLSITTFAVMIVLIAISCLVFYVNVFSHE